MATRIALVGAGGKMGTRISANLARMSHYRLACCEKSEAGVADLAARELAVVPAAEAVAEAEIAIFAVPDTAMGVVTAELTPHMRAGSTVLMLDPAAAAAGEVALRSELHYVVCHPCHPPLFGPQPDPETYDFFGGISAPQDVVIALWQGSEEALAEAEPVCRDMFAPVAKVHRITVDQMALLEPAMAEVVSCSAIALVRDVLEEAVKAGVPREAATAFLLGHVQVQLAILLGFLPVRMSDAAMVALRWGRERIIRPEWKDAFAPEQVEAVIREMLHPEARI
ncbi:MAG: NAD(P)-binding domain-containing protein [Gemmatimonadales bacterium]|nr:NAD(P)-binding domain-containing protein [Gemmatimonadales bacterium]